MTKASGKWGRDGDTLDACCSVDKVNMLSTNIIAFVSPRYRPHDIKARNLRPRPRWLAERSPHRRVIPQASNSKQEYFDTHRQAVATAKPLVKHVDALA